MNLNIKINDFKQMPDDFSGVYGLFLKDDANIDIFIPEIKEAIKISAKDNNNLIYIGESETVMRRIYANHLQGVGASALRNTLWEIFDKNNFSKQNTEKNNGKEKFINEWLKGNTYFKTYATNEHCQTETYLIKKYNPILNGGSSKFKKEIEKHLFS